MLSFCSPHGCAARSLVRLTWLRTLAGGLFGALVGLATKELVSTDAEESADHGYPVQT